MHARGTSIRERVDQVRLCIREACERAVRNPEEVELLLAAKTASPDRVRAALDAGLTFVGENKIQEALGKVEALRDDPRPVWHFIGHLQSNKARDALRFARMIHSIDRMRLARKLQTLLEREDRPPLDALLQVNTSREPSKFGVPPEKALRLARDVAGLDRLRVRGLMTIGRFSAEEARVRPCFRMLRELRDQLRQDGPARASFEVLSMGMSHDFPVAIEEGATLVRIGTAILGERSTPDSYYWSER